MLYEKKLLQCHPMYTYHFPAALRGLWYIPNRHLNSNQVKFIFDTKIQMPRKEVKWKTMCQRDAKATVSCTNRCPSDVRRHNFFSQTTSVTITSIDLRSQPKSYVERDHFDILYYETKHRPIATNARNVDNTVAHTCC